MPSPSWMILSQRAAPRTATHKSRSEASASVWSTLLPGSRVSQCHRTTTKDGELTNGGSVRDGGEERNNEDSQLEHGGVGGRLMPSTGISPRSCLFFPFPSEHEKPGAELPHLRSILRSIASPSQGFQNRKLNDLFRSLSQGSGQTAVTRDPPYGVFCHAFPASLSALGIRCRRPSHR